MLNYAENCTPPGGEISVTGYREDSEIVLRVRDTGKDVSSEILPRVFDMGARAGRFQARDEEALDVGLTLARILVELHGGSINVHSEGPGRGSEFVVRLPVGAPAGARAGDAGTAAVSAVSIRPP